MWEKRDGAFQSTSYSELKELVYRFAAGMMTLGIQKGDRLALLAEGRTHWVVAEMGMFYLGAIDVPLSIQLNEPADLTFRLIHSGARMVVTSASQAKKINAIKDDINSLDLTSISGLVFMGGPYSVYDEHSWLNDESQLIKNAIDADILIMGVCLGAQLVSKALGAKVCKAEYMETGWHMIETDTSKLGHLHPLKLEKNFEVFEWHEDVFTLPEGATPIFSGSNHENQGYVLGKILVMQFHLEMTEHMVNDWLEQYQSCLPAPSPSVQTPQQINERLNERLNDLHRHADIIYDWWLNHKA
ncbi:MAG: AMP-binding protein [Gammaproteobacteria bacterium]|nr:AMP-binding protein [Gammaproteobacteria bacterium]